MEGELTTHCFFSLVPHVGFLRWVLQFPPFISTLSEICTISIV